MIRLSFASPEAKEILARGDVLAIPTETVYGLAIRADSKEAYQKLVDAKRRPPEKPIAVMTSKEFDLDSYFILSDGARRVAEKMLPGPLTILLKAKENTPYQCHLGTGVCGLRIPEEQALLDFLSSLPFPLQVTSANLSGEPSTTKEEEVIQTFESNRDVAGIVEGKCRSGIPTTVVDLTSDEVKIVRQGQITKEEIEKIYQGE